MAYLLGGLLALVALQAFGHRGAYRAVLGFLACHLVVLWLATDHSYSIDELTVEATIQQATLAALASDVFQKAALLTCLFFCLLQGRTGIRQFTRQWGVRLALFYFATCSLIALASPTPAFLWNEAWVLAFLLVFVGSRDPVETKLRIVAWYLAFLIFASLVGIPLAFQKVMDPAMIGYFPFRLRGILGNPNAIGMACGAGLVLALYLRSFHLYQRIALVAMYLSALVLAQSKTILVFSALLLVVRLGMTLRQRLRQYLTASSLRGFAWGMCLLVLLGLPFLNPSGLFSGMTSLLGTTEEAAMSLTGRQAIWAVTLKTWAQHPVTGYGPGLWGIEFRNQMGMPYAGQAHNQYLQTLGEFGLLGMVVLGIYLGRLIRRARKLGVALPIGMPLILLLLVVGLVEAPLRDPIYGAGFLVHVTLLASLSVEPAKRQTNDGGKT